MPKESRFTAMLALGCLLAIACALALSFLLASQTVTRVGSRSAIATARLHRAQRLWRSGNYDSAIAEHVIAYRMIGESTLRLALGDYYASRVSRHLDAGDFQAAFDDCTRAVSAMGRYEAEIGISYSCPGMQTKALLQTR